MERAVALKKLGRILGKSLGYRVDTKAPTRDEREAARLELPAAVAARKELDERLEARRRAILAADPEYQELQAAYSAAKERASRISSTLHHYKITVGVSNSLFFTVKAQGDSWEEVIEKLTVKETQAA